MKPASQRLFVVGDAAGYVEPFTGEGIAWAIRGGRAVVPFVLRGMKGWNPKLAGQWSRSLGTLVAERQRLCRVLAWALRHPMLVRGMIRVVEAMPGLGRAVIRRLNRESELEFIDIGTGHRRTA